MLFVQVLDRALVIALQRPVGAGANDGMKNRDNMILRWEYIRDYVLGNSLLRCTTTNLIGQSESQECLYFP